MQVVDFAWICLSVALVVSLYPAASSAAMLHNSVAALAGVLFYLAASAQGLYQTQWLRRPFVSEVRALLLCWLWVVAPLMLLGFATKVLAYFSRVATVSWILLAPALMVVCRLAARAGSWAGRAAPRRAAIVGVTPFGEQICQWILRSPDLGLHVVGLFDDRVQTREESASVTAGRVGSVEALLALARDGAVDVVYIALPLKAERRVQELILRLQDTTASVYIAFDFVSLAGGGYRQIGSVGNLPVIPLLTGAQRSVRSHALTLVRAMRYRLPRGRRHLHKHPILRKSAAPPRMAAERSTSANPHGPGTVG